MEGMDVTRKVDSSAMTSLKEANTVRAKTSFQHAVWRDCFTVVLVEEADPYIEQIITWKRLLGRIVVPPTTFL